MTTTTDATPATPSAPDPQGGLRIGETNEFTLFFNVKPGMADKLRASIEKVRAITANREKFMSIGTVHDFRWVIFDDGTRLLFTSNFDGDWDKYIVDFVAIVPDVFDEILQWVEGYPGITDPNINAYIHAHQVQAANYFRAYPFATTNQVQKALRVNEAFQAVLDSPEFGVALKDPANAALLATPAFQKLLDQAST
jgi:hypothetical protein